jgi:SAM-dependent methyltransferase
MNQLITQLITALEKLGRNVLLSDNSKQKEYNFVWKQLSSCDKILDIGCGVGLFLNYAPDRIIGIDINPNNVDFCKTKAFTAFVGDALNLEFPDNSFEGVHSSHVCIYSDPIRLCLLLRKCAGFASLGAKSSSH